MTAAGLGRDGDQPPVTQDNCLLPHQNALTATEENKIIFTPLGKRK